MYVCSVLYNIIYGLSQGFTKCYSELYIAYVFNIKFNENGWIF